MNVYPSRRYCCRRYTEPEATCATKLTEVQGIVVHNCHRTHRRSVGDCIQISHGNLCGVPDLLQNSQKYRVLWCNCHRTHRSIGYCGTAVTELTEVLCRVKTEGIYPRYRSVGTLQNLSVIFRVKLSINNHIVRLVHKNHIIRTCLMYHAACKVEFQPFTRWSYSRLTFFNFL